MHRKTLCRGFNQPGLNAVKRTVGCTEQERSNVQIELFGPSVLAYCPSPEFSFQHHINHGDSTRLWNCKHSRGRSTWIRSSKPFSVSASSWPVRAMRHPVSNKQKGFQCREFGICKTLKQAQLLIHSNSVPSFKLFQDSELQFSHRGKKHDSVHISQGTVG